MAFTIQSACDVSEQPTESVAVLSSQILKHARPSVANPERSFNLCIGGSRQLGLINILKLSHWQYLCCRGPR